jgi:hypothetical protein
MEECNLMRLAESEDVRGGDVGSGVSVRLRREKERFVGGGDMPGERVGGGADRVSRDAFYLGGADDVEGDFSATGDEEFLHGGYRVRSGEKGTRWSCGAAVEGNQAV